MVPFSAMFFSCAEQGMRATDKRLKNGYLCQAVEFVELLDGVSNQVNQFKFLRQLDRLDAIAQSVLESADLHLRGESATYTCKRLIEISRA